MITERKPYDLPAGTERRSRGSGRSAKLAAASVLVAAVSMLTAVLAPGALAQPAAAGERPDASIAAPAEQQEQAPDQPRQQTLAEMAADADAIAVVKVRETEYLRTRSFPSSGWALLEVLVPYRGVERGELLEVTERGLGESRCYYPEIGTWQFEGDRFLVFLKKAEKDTWRGRAPACRLPVLVDESNRFLLRYPVKGLTIEDPAVIETVQYSDPAARVDASDFTRAKVQELETFYSATRVISDDPLAPPDLIYQYTRGISLSNVRRLMGKLSRQ